MASKRKYLSIAELEEFADIDVTNNTEAYDQISQAEELIDSYAGFQQKHLNYIISGRLSSSGSTTDHTLQVDHKNVFQDDYFTFCEIEIVGGTGVGERKSINASTYAGVITTDAFSTALDSTSVYRIYQVGKFPRIQDVFYDSQNLPYKYYKQIPEAVKRATAAQVAYRIKVGDSYFDSNDPDMESESIGKYSYSRGSKATTYKLVAPRAKELLHGIINRTGKITMYR